jgi:formylglycine-generating enzyme required for sulfatase activity
MIAGSGENDAKASERDWYVTPDGRATMVRIRSYPDFRLGPVRDEADNYSEVAYPADWTAEDITPVDEFWMSDREVSVATFRAVCPEHPWFKSEEAKADDRRPMRAVKWFEAVIFCNRLSRSHQLTPYYDVNESLYDWERGIWNPNSEPFLFPSIPNLAGTGYRLPTEREWEYACRALSTTAYSFGGEANHLSFFGWFAGKSSPAACGSLHPSRWGLSDMHGNVWEWCWERSDDGRWGTGKWKAWWDDVLTGSSSRVLRGGSFSGNPADLRSADRFNLSPDDRYIVNGFRFSRTK